MSQGSGGLRGVGQGWLGGGGQGRLGDDCAGHGCHGVLGGGQGSREVLVLVMVIWVDGRGT